MSLNSLRHRMAVATEITALLLTTIGLVGVETVAPASATTEQPVVAYSVPTPTGITIDSPWVTDATGTFAWALGVNQSGMGVLAKRDIAAATITTTTTVQGEIGATDGRLITPTGNIAFLAKRQGTGGRLVVINPTTGLRVSQYDLAATDTNPRGISWNSTGAAVMVGSNGATPQVSKVTVATGALVNSVATSSTALASGFTYGTKMAFLSSAPTVKLVMIKDQTTAALDTTTALGTITHNLVDPLVVGATAWFGSDSAPGRLVSIDMTSRSVTSTVAIGADESGLRNLTLAPGGASIYATTVTAGHTKLMNIRLSDGVRLGSIDLGAITGATSITVSGRYVDVTFSGSTALVRTTTASAPSAPTSVSIVEIDGALDVLWTSSTSEEPVVTYRASTTDGHSCVTTATRCTIGELTNGTAYTVTVTATSYAGSTASATLVATPATLPSAPMNVTAARGDRSVLVSWDAPPDGGRPILGYAATLQPGGQQCVTVDTHCEFIGLTNGVEYRATVSARTVWGDSPSSVASNASRAAAAPDSPARPTAIRGDSSVELSWDAPFDQGEQITEYLVLRDGETVCRTTNTRCTIINLANGIPVRFSVRAINSVGVSAASDPSTPVTPATHPGEVLRLSTLRGDSTISVTWESGDDGGELVRRFIVTTNPESEGCITVDTHCDVTGLSNGTPYTVSIAAVNDVGEGPTVTSAEVVPATVPNSPRDVVINDDVDASTVAWIPGDDGGEAVTEYIITVWNDAESLDQFTTNETTVTIPDIHFPNIYRVTLVARNVVGDSSPVTFLLTPLEPPMPPVIPEPPVDPEPPVTPEPPQVSTPTSPTAVRLTRATSKTYTLTWSAPSSGGSPILDYRIAKRIAGGAAYIAVADDVSPRLSVKIARPKNGKAVYVRIVSVNAVGTSTPPTIVKLKGKKIYAIPSVLAVRFSDAAAIFGSVARSTPNDGTSFASGFAHSSIL